MRSDRRSGAIKIPVTAEERARLDVLGGIDALRDILLDAARSRGPAKHGRMRFDKDAYRWMFGDTTLDTSDIDVALDLVRTDGYRYIGTIGDDVILLQDIHR